MKKEEFLAMSLMHRLKINVIYHNGSNDSKNTNLIAKDLDGECEYEVIPILRPLSDLTKPIDHNGEKFVPIERILGLGKKDGDASSPWNYKILINDNNLIRIELVRSQQTLELNFRDLSLKHAMLLIDWHFNLMDESEEFINVNDLDMNPYK